MTRAAQENWPQPHRSGIAGPLRSRVWPALAHLLLAACTARPAGEAAERDAAERAGQPFVRPHAERELPPLSERPALREVLRFAFWSNAELEQAWFEWRMALERIPQAVALDDPRLSFEYLFSDANLSRWDRTTLGVTQMIPFPGKREAAGDIALEAAIAARHRFEAAKFGLQAEVVAAFHGLLVADRSIAIAEQNAALLRELREQTLRRLTVGQAMQGEATKADLETGIAENDLLARRAERPPALAQLNALLSRPPDATLVPSPAAPPRLPADDGVVLLRIAERNPDLAALAAEVAGRERALDLAWKEYLPDLELGFGLQGTMERMLMGLIRLPLQLDRIQAGIRETQAGIRAAQAALRARRDQLGAQATLQLWLARDMERQAALLRGTLLPRAEEVVAATRAAYGTGGVTFLELLDAQRSLLALRMWLLQVDATQATAVARLEAMAALDFAALGSEGGA
jgi:outer membrane protein TolC